ncbi:glycosyltransferase [Gymnodinialimonas sp. 2305UL16-5]|uniref:glycosyltransferase n=1 Tax=Gymnodinialimonas mytili TaxID=3126503 RepID=UPI0030B0DB21
MPQTEGWSVLIHEPHSYDVVMLADLTRYGDMGYRIRQELISLANAGYRCGLYHLPVPSRKEIHPDIQRCLWEALATIIEPDAEVQTKLALVYGPGRVSAPVALPSLTAERVVLVVDSAPNIEQMGLWWSFAFGPMIWAPTNRWVRGRLQDLNSPVPMLEEDWRAIAAPRRARSPLAPARLRPVVGRISGTTRGEWPATIEEFDTIYPRNPAFDVWIHGTTPSKLYPKDALEQGRTLISGRDMSVARFLEAIDAMVYFPRQTNAELPEAAITTALMSSIPVVLPPALSGHFGPGPRYVEPSEAAAAVTELLEDHALREDLGEQAKAQCARLFSEEAYLGRIDALIGRPQTTCPGQEAPPSAPALQIDQRRKTALFISSNGVGLGHASRLLAIARRLHADIEPIFLCLGKVTSIVERFGYRAEYVPSHGDISASLSQWSQWFRLDVTDMLDQYQPEMVVYDGNNPTAGLVSAVMSHGDAKLAWVRRAMGQGRPSPYLGNSKFFDCIIEPGEYAAEMDNGPTKPLRHQVQAVPPIRLLDAHETLDRAEARASLGLDPDRPAVLIHLGSGGNQDIVGLIDQFVGHLQRFDGTQIVIAEWADVAMPLPQWPGTRVLRGFPMARFFNAFDFSVAAAGYNTFHEVIASGLPSIFYANRHPSMDDQGARAKFAQDHGAGFDLTDEELTMFPTLCQALLNPSANAAVRQACASFDQTNGAQDAADILSNLAGVY